MQYLLWPHIDEAAWAAQPQVEQQRRIGRFGAFVGAYRPQPSAAAKTVRIADGTPQVLDGPYATTKEQLSGVYIVDVRDLDAALSWAARNPRGLRPRRGALALGPTRP